MSNKNQSIEFWYSFKNKGRTGFYPVTGFDKEKNIWEISDEGITDLKFSSGIKKEDLLCHDKI